LSKRQKLIERRGHMGIIRSAFLYIRKDHAWFKPLLQEEKDIYTYKGMQL
jgi:hypothetical protein